jgi:ubiquinone/menaquinone biosynthesis C-methylase UbiE
MNPKIYNSVFSALKKELEERGYSAQDVETLVKNYSWFLSEYSLLRVLLRSKLPIKRCQESLDFLVKRHEFLAKEIKSKSTVLDVGCGLGVLACLLAKKSCRVYGIDIEEDNIEVAERLSEMLNVGGLCTFQKTEPSALSFDEHTFDYVILSWTLHDIKLEDREALLSECVRVLKSHGRLLILDPESQLNFNQLQETMLKHSVKRTQKKVVSNIYDHGTLSNAVLAIYQKQQTRE